MKIINSNGFAEISNFVFSEIVSTKKFNSFDNSEDCIVLQKIKNSEVDSVWYINPKIDIKENDLVFCHTEVVEIFFDFVANIKNLKNIKLITHQSDRAIDKSLWKLKPSCISEWYSTNINYKNSDLFSVPLGIGNDYIQNYKNEKALLSKRIEGYVNKVSKAYMNFRINTNTVERLRALFDLKDKNWIVLENNVRSLEDYLDTINKFQFTICPWGNGLDTHRMWESLYLNSIPVTRFHTAYDQFRSLPIIFVNKWSDLNLEYLVQESKNLNYKNLNILDLNYWEKKIKKSNIESKEVFHKKLSELEIDNLKIRYHETMSKNKKKKNIVSKLVKYHPLKIKHYMLSKNS